MVIYRIVDALTGIIACAMVIFGPWAFGTTQAWSIWTMNMAGYALGMLWLLKLGTAWFQGFHTTGWYQIEREVANYRQGRNPRTETRKKAEDRNPNLAKPAPKGSTAKTANGPE